MTIAVVPLELAANEVGGWTGLVIFLSIFVGFLRQPLARRMTNVQALSFALIPLGFLVLLAGVWLNALTLGLVGTCIPRASSYGFTYLAAAPPDDRARATAGLFDYAYFGFSLPVITGGALSDLIGLLPEMGRFAIGPIVMTILIVKTWKRTVPTVTARHSTRA